MASKLAILDTGALVAFLSRNDRHHLWASSAFKRLPSILVTCEAVLSEFCFLMRHSEAALRTLNEILTNGAIKVLPLHEEIPYIFSLMRKYADVPMSFADAALVRLAELQAQAVVVTVDSDFKIYRMKKAKKIPLIIP